MSHVHNKILRIRQKTRACEICALLPGRNGFGVLQIHHVIPRTCGGTHKNSNLVALCAKCHRAWHRYDSDAVYWKEFETSGREGFLSGAWVKERRRIYGLHSVSWTYQNPQRSTSLEVMRVTQ